MDKVNHIVILGKQYPSEAEANKAHKDLIWFSYRSHFSKLPESESTSDSGWGCMLRSGQMIFANGLLRHFSETNQEKNKIKIIQLFVDTQSSLFSIHSISEIARREFSLLPGEWYSPNRIAFCLASLLNSNEISQQLHLKSHVMISDRPISFDPVIAIMTGNSAKKTLEKNIFDLIRFSRDILVEEHEITKSGVLLYIIAMIGLEEPEKKYFSTLFQLFNHPYSIGMIGGRHSMGYYFTGIIEDKISFLDPHITQQADTSIDKIKLESYQSNKFSTMSKKLIGPTVGLGFYLKDVKALNQFWQFLNELQNKEKEGFFLTLSTGDASEYKDEELVEEEDYFILE